MTIADRILAYLAALPQGATDREIFDAIDAKYSQQINSRCRALASQGLIQRREVGGTLRNFHIQATKSKPAVESKPAIPGRPWFWEGNVQSKAVRFLVESGWDITRVADTASREAGRDISAEKGGAKVWVSVKGRPEGTERTKAPTQARTWFHGALFDIVCWRGEDEEAQLMIAMPEYGTYRNLSKRVAWLADTARYQCLWVQQDGSVKLE